jgi:hypothetical protein
MTTMTALIVHVPAIPADGALPAFSENHWLLDGDTKPLNVSGNVAQYAGAGVPVVDITQHPRRTHQHVAALAALHDARLAAAQKVASG